MSVETITTRDSSTGRARIFPGGDRSNGRDRSSLEFPVLEKDPGPVGCRLTALPGRHPVWTHVWGIVLVLGVIASLSIVAGLLVTRALLHVPGVPGADESLIGFLARHRSSGLTEASLVGSIMAGGVVLPIVAGVVAVVAAAARHWRLAAFLLFGLAVESASYRATTLAVHRHRPTVPRLEKLPVDASYPSGHTAASIVVYGGLALLLTSLIENRAARIAIWAVAALVPVFVAFSRMYRGMHHPLDVAGGVMIGIAALYALVVVTRATGSVSK
jgi:membrane-associated phospholipid phosphatase